MLSGLALWDSIRVNPAGTQWKRPAGHIARFFAQCGLWVLYVVKYKWGKISKGRCPLDPELLSFLDERK